MSTQYSAHGRIIRVHRADDGVWHFDAQTVGDMEYYTDYDAPDLIEIALFIIRLG